MAHTVLDLEDVFVKWTYLPCRQAELQAINEDGQVESVPISVAAAEFLIRFGMNSGD